MKLKSGLLLVAGLIAYSSVKAQVQYIPYSAHTFCLSLGVGPTALFGDLNKPQIRLAGRANLDYNISPYIATGIEAQYGTLAAKGSKGTRGLKTKNQFFAANLNVRCGIAQFTGKRVTDLKKAFGGIYGGVGLGLIKSNVSEIGTVFYNGKPILNSKTDEMEFVIPLNAGWNIELPKMGKVNDLMFNVNLQYNLVQGEYIDGYNYENVHNNHHDGYMFLSFALRYNFGKFR